MRLYLDDSMCESDEDYFDDAWCEMLGSEVPIIADNCFSTNNVDDIKTLWGLNVTDTKDYSIEEIDIKNWISCNRFFLPPEHDNIPISLSEEIKVPVALNIVYSVINLLFENEYNNEVCIDWSQVSKECGQPVAYCMWVWWCISPCGSEINDSWHHSDGIQIEGVFEAILWRLNFLHNIVGVIAKQNGAETLELDDKEACTRFISLLNFAIPDKVTNESIYFIVDDSNGSLDRQIDDTTNNHDNRQDGIEISSRSLGCEIKNINRQNYRRIGVEELRDVARSSTKCVAVIMKGRMVTVSDAVRQGLLKSVTKKFGQLSQENESSRKEYVSRLKSYVAYRMSLGHSVPISGYSSNVNSLN